jgi:hypothetical protein
VDIVHVRVRPLSGAELTWAPETQKRHMVTSRSANFPCLRSALIASCRTVVNWGLIQVACSISPGWRFSSYLGDDENSEIGLRVRDYRARGAFREGRWVVAADGQGTRSCPCCGEPSRSRHSWQVRYLQDLPIQCVPAALVFRSARWRCRNEQCARRTFAEKLAIALPFSPRTPRVGELVQPFGHAAGGRISERLPAGLGIPISDSAVLRQLKCHLHKHRETKPLRTIAIDDWSWRKGAAYGTIIVDLERRDRLVADAHCS